MGGWSGRGGQGGSEQRIEVFVKIQKNRGEGGDWEDPVGGQGGCERRNEVFVKNQKKVGGSGGRLGVSEWKLL